MTELNTAIHLTVRNRTIAELPPQMAAGCMMITGAAGQADDGYTTLTITDDAAEKLAQILIRYNSVVAGDGTEDPVQVRVDEDHDIAFWDAIATDLLVAREVPPPRGTTALVYSIGKTSDR
jgi:hypothetical protein